MNLPAFISYVALTAFSPGPNNILSMSASSRKGFREGFKYCLGATLGNYIVMALCAGFSALLLSVVPIIEPFMKYVGAAYILWLAWSVVLKDKRDNSEKTSEEKKLRSNLFVLGVILQLVNVKGVLYGITSMSTFILPYHKEFHIVAMYAAVLSAAVLASTTCWALFGTFFHNFFYNHKKAVDLIMAFLLVMCALSLLFT